MSEAVPVDFDVTTGEDDSTSESNRSSRIEVLCSFFEHNVRSQVRSILLGQADDELEGLTAVCPDRDEVTDNQIQVAVSHLSQDVFSSLRPGNATVIISIILKIREVLRDGSDAIDDLIKAKIRGLLDGDSDENQAVIRELVGVFRRENYSVGPELTQDIIGSVSEL